MVEGVVVAAVETAAGTADVAAAVAGTAGVAVAVVGTVGVAAAVVGVDLLAFSNTQVQCGQACHSNDIQHWSLKTQCSCSQTAWKVQVWVAVWPLNWP